MSLPYLMNPFTSDLYPNFQHDKQGTDVIYYKGVFDPNLISELSKQIWVQYQDNHAVRHKVFSIFIELSQNISYYSSERAHGTHFNSKTSGIGSVLIVKNETSSTLFFENVVGRRNFDIIFDRFRNISSMSFEQLRTMRKNIRENTLSEETLGANFGLVQVALLCRNNLEIKLEETINDFFYFSIKSTVLF